ncbi:hypothetical protein [Devosia sp.]|uniref:hypothetical protein n=1 Tax=Devosia sp. TaxID=1871048 RepID=UPI001AD17426|nr:hypothetical protein [Devosia sp.]MBN9333858.1 hypothetical protein [Devosia sp.]
MLPRLEAQRQIDSINAMSTGFGGMTGFERQRYVSRLQRQAQGAPAAAKATPAGLAAMGVSVVVITAEDTANG